jgi:hypothetical protein
MSSQIIIQKFQTGISPTSSEESVTISRALDRERTRPHYGSVQCVRTCAVHKKNSLSEVGRTDPGTRSFNQTVEEIQFSAPEYQSVETSGKGSVEINNVWIGSCAFRSHDAVSRNKDRERSFRG